MKDPCGNSHPLFNSGSVQTGRIPLDLYPESLVYDERTVSDWLVYLNAYAKHINYFSLNDGETASSNWEDFFNRDVSILLAKIAEEQIALLQSRINSTLQVLQHNTLGETDAKTNFTLLFAHIFNICWRLDNHYKNLPGQLAFREQMSNRIFSKVELRLSRLISYYKSAKNQNLLDFSNPILLENDYHTIENLGDWDLLSLWFQQSGHPTWSGYYAAVLPDSSPFLKIVNPPTTAAAKINLASKYQLLTESLKGVIGAFAGVVSDAEKQFNETITDWPNHQPDKALLISFLKVLSLYRKELNRLPAKHLDHYYKDILKLSSKEPKADSVFLVLEPAKNQSSVQIKSGVGFKGGKDETGTERIYESIKETIVNKAKVESLKAVLHQGGSIHAAQNVATIDGLEKELEFPEEGWPAFGTSQFAKADIGFAIASNYLFLKEGTRTIKIILDGNKSISQTTLNSIATRTKMKVTGEKGWLDLTGVTIVKDEEDATIITFTGTLSAEEKAVVALDTKTHERNQYPNLPVAEVFISDLDYQHFKNLALNNVKVNVKAVGCSQFEVTTDNGKADLSKPFNPFGTLPKKGNALVLGLQEMLSKKLLSLKLKFKWQVSDSSERNVSSITSSRSKFNFEQLKGTVWSPLSVPSSAYSSNLSTFSLSSLATQNADLEEGFSTNSTIGFLRLQLNSDLGHSGYPLELTNHILALNSSTPPANTALPKPYYIPAIEKLEVEYIAESPALLVAQSNDYEADKTIFYHITPYGGYEASGNMLDLGYPGLLPALPNEGELYLGLSDFGSRESVNVLISVKEGSSNPLKSKQDVVWEYLENNRWKAFQHGQLNDGTNGLIQTGIVEFVLPFEFEDKSTFFREPNTWLRATVKQHTDAICKIIDVFAQGVEARLVSMGHAAPHYQSPLPEKTVSKLLVSNSSIKKITQPLGSRGGKPEENADEFRRRVSERLRHKERSITIWDYERLVLEEFPEIAKAKALSHTKYEIDEVTNELKYSEAAPGHVALVCVPKEYNPEQNSGIPYTPIDTLDKIEKQLSKLLPDWVTHHVRNPLFERVHVDFLVKFLPEIKDFDYYKGVLDDDLKEFLSPWSGDLQEQFRFDWRIHKSAVIDFLDERPYVDYVKNVKLNVYYGSSTSDVDLDVNEARPRYAVSVLISKENHTINPA